MLGPRDSMGNKINRVPALPELTEGTTDGKQGSREGFHSY